MNFDSYYHGLSNTIIDEIYKKIRESAGAQGPAGPQGPVGPQGATGPAGPKYNDTFIRNAIDSIEAKILSNNNKNNGLHTDLNEQIENLKESVWPLIQSNYQNIHYEYFPQLVFPLLNFVVPNNTINEDDYKIFRKLPKSIFYDGGFIQGAGGQTGLNYETMLADYRYYLKYKDCGQQDYYSGFPSKVTMVKCNENQEPIIPLFEVDFMVWNNYDDISPTDRWAFDEIATHEEFLAHLRNCGIRTKTGITNNRDTYKQIYVDWENVLYTYI
jgi:hypothetical protein